MKNALPKKTKFDVLKAGKTIRTIDHPDQVCISLMYHTGLDPEDIYDALTVIYKTADFAPMHKLLHDTGVSLAPAK